MTDKKNCRSVDLQAERSNFPITKNFAYLDHASRGPLSPPARAMIEKVAHEMSHLHPNQLQEMSPNFCAARKAMGDLIGAPVESIGLVPNTSSGIGLAAGSLPIEAGDNVICAREEFPANIYPWLNLQRKGVEIRFLDRPPGGPQVDQVRAIMDDRTRVLALSWIGFCDGGRINTAAMANLCAEKKIFFVLDAIQGVGAVQVDLQGIDLLVCGSGKWTLAPQGGGFVYVRPSLIERLQPDRVGWLSMAHFANLEHLESLTNYEFTLAKDARRVETGSNSPLTQLALGASCAYLHGLGTRAIQERIFQLGDYLSEGLKKKGRPLAFPVPEGLRTGIVCFPMPDAAACARRLNDRGVLLSAREGNIRVGIHFYNNEEDLDQLLDNL